MRLRVLAGQGANSGDKARFLVLTLYDSLSFNDGLLAVVQHDTKKFVIDDDAEPGKHAHDEFWWVNDMDGSHVDGVDVHTGDEESKKATVEFWDYSRLTEVNGVETEEFIFVEMNMEVAVRTSRA